MRMYLSYKEEALVTKKGPVFTFSEEVDVKDMNPSIKVAISSVYGSIDQIKYYIMC